MSSIPHKSGRSARAVEREASRWAARLSLGVLSPEDEAAFAAWRAADPAHAGALDRMTAAVESLGSAEPLARAVDARAREAQAARRRVLGGAGSVAAALVLVGGITLWADPATLGADRRTGVGQVEAVVLADGSRLWLDAKSAVDIDVTATDRTVTLRRGRVFVEAAHAPPGAPAFTVEAGGGRAIDVGTAFVVERLGDQVEVTVTEGRVDVVSGGRVVALAEGQAATYEAGIVPARHAPDVLPAAWRQGRLVISRRPLSAVVAQLNRYSRKPIVLTDRAAGRRIVSGVVRVDRVEDDLDSLARTQGLSTTDIGVAVWLHR
ncbi:hypothetical protein BZG35_08445 [Brevundimonas sp. LM2]|uniref:FecR family protein n=1 Tax=Brevundimonas sp. LM2 TaxID=1938605 RepID=UPI000983C3B9|nr:FecR domain-containing protein [Brevundimonas sp. LM2]AQR61676.1 hypothetical protein BZG35_08445 [Brevundimonas sp. LM2]